MESKSRREEGITPRDVREHSRDYDEELNIREHSKHYDENEKVPMKRPNNTISKEATLRLAAELGVEVTIDGKFIYAQFEDTKVLYKKWKTLYNRLYGVKRRSR